MRNTITATQFKDHLNLPLDYKVDGVFCYGTSFQDRAIDDLRQYLLNTELNAEIIPFDSPIMHSVREINIIGKKFWFVMAYGGAELSEYLHMACIFGSQKNIFIGSCGGLKPGIKSGNFIIPTSSYGQESSVRIYNRKSPVQYSDVLLNTSLENIISTDENIVLKGPMITCQGSLGQTADDVQKWSTEGYFGVDMETSTVFAVSNYFSVPSAACVYVSDNLVEGQTPLSEDYKKQADMRQQRKYLQIQAALKVLIE